ncbi:hypothetical protein JXL83_04110 [candidate division WOR-3 bacterium]|nr:hypothetical protein [candidate division WOR-3 bacterium]
MKRMLILLTPFLVPVSTASQNRIVWSRTYGGQYSDGGKQVVSTTDGGYAIIGYTWPVGSTDSDVLLIKTDSDGNQIWSRTFGGNGFDAGYSLVQTQDKGFAITGYTGSNTDGDKDLIIIKTDSSGNFIWQNFFGGDGEDCGLCIREIQNGDLVVSGYTESFGAGQFDVYLIRINSSGDSIFAKMYGDTASEFGACFVQTADGGFAITGFSGSGGTGNNDYYLIKTDAMGIFQWHTYFNPGNCDFAHSVIIDHQGRFIIAGHGDVHSSDFSNIILVNCNSLGGQLWSSHYDIDLFYNFGRSIALDGYGKYIVCGMTKNRITGDNDILLLSADTSGTINWHEKYGSSGDDYAFSVLRDDSGFVVAGQTNSSGAGHFDVILMRMSNVRADFTASPLTGIAPFQAAFCDLSAGRINIRQWDFNNDGIIDSYEQNPVHTYGEPGIYSVRLIVGDGAVLDTLTKIGYIEAFDEESGVEYNGTNSFSLCPASPEINLTDSFTIEAWIKPYSFGENANLGMGRVIDKNSISIFLAKTAFNYNCLVLRMNHSGGVTSHSFTPDSSVILGEWQHIAVAYRASSGEVKIYINGQEKSLSFQNSPQGPLQDNLGTDMYIGNSANNSMTFDGTIDELRIWNTVRTAQEITENMDQLLTGNENGLAGYWKMNEANGDTIYDCSTYDKKCSLDSTRWVQGTPFYPTGIHESPVTEISSSFFFKVFPNTVCSELFFSFNIPVQSNVEISVFDLSGRIVDCYTLPEIPAGSHRVRYNVEKLPENVYFARLSCGLHTANTKFIVLH